MNKKELISELKKLREEVRPTEQWKNTGREILLSQIRSQQVAEPGWLSEVMKPVQAIFSGRMLAFRFAPAAVLGVLLIVGIATATGLPGKSLPGDTFYSFKIASEGVQKTFTFGDESKTQLSMEFAGKRLAEVKELNQQNNNDTGTVKSEKIKNTLASYKQNIEEVKKHLDALANSTDPNQTMVMVSMINQQMTKYSSTLENSQNDLKTGVGDDNNKTEINELINTSEAIAEKAIDIILNQYLVGTASPSDEDLSNILNQKIDKLEIKLVNLDKDYKGLIDNYNQADKLITSEDKLTLSKAIKDIGSQIEKIKPILVEAIKLIPEKRFHETVAKIQEIDNSIETAQRSISDLEKKISELAKSN